MFMNKIADLDLVKSVLLMMMFFFLIFEVLIQVQPCNWKMKFQRRRNVLIYIKFEY